MTDPVQEAVSETAKQVTEACDSHLKICLARLQGLGVTGVNRTIELEGKKYLVSVKPVVGESAPAAQAVAGDAVAAVPSSAPAAPVAATEPTPVAEKVEVPVGEKPAEASASPTASDSDGTSEPPSVAEVPSAT
jgi:hypothetical protein